MSLPLISAQTIPEIGFTTDLPWGSNRLAIDFAGGPYGFFGLGEAQTNLISGRYRELCLTEIPGNSITTQVYRIPTQIIWEGKPDSIYYDLELQHHENSVNIRATDFAASIMLKPTLCGQLWTYVEDADLLRCVFENYFRILVAYRLLELGGAVFHSSAVIDNGAHIFLGKSGAGKTTISRLALNSGKQVLSDDLNAVMPVKGVFQACRIPFAGEMGQRDVSLSTHPVSGFYRIAKAFENRNWALPLGQSLAILLTCSPFINSDHYRMSRLLEILETIVKKYGVQGFEFTRDQNFLSYLNNTSA
ncbi:hypothetical protein ACFL17_05350 [Pseudomonadota bacterium]